MTQIIAARTHPPEYLLHKYWSRKPHNVLARLLSELVPSNGKVLDPFCGSGVLLSEAARLGIDAVGFDINPIAVLISRVTLNPPASREFSERANAILGELEALHGDAFVATDAQQIRYVVHECVVECVNCVADWAVSEATHAGRTYRCPSCNGRLNFNLEKLKSTRVREVIKPDGRVENGLEASRQQDLSAQLFGRVSRAYSYRFAENRRTLAHAGLETSSLFTPRNFSLLCEVADRAHSEDEVKLREALVLLLSATVAQCSRLIPYRERMTGGGPAWSVPGFWVPPVHLEANPFVHLRARLGKFVRGFERLEARPCLGSAAVYEQDAIDGLQQLADADECFDLVFLDPPYGDSVPYVEFSSVWNSFLREPGDPRKDLSVSDRVGAGDAWSRYRGGLAATVSRLRRLLKAHGKLLITFNSHDDRAWEALFAALQDAGYRCASVAYQAPAVVSAKAQFAPEGSYVGDFYCVYEVAPPDADPTRSLDPIRHSLRVTAAAREGRLPRNLARRTLVAACIANNLSADVLPDAVCLLEEMFDDDGDQLLLRGQFPRDVPLIRDLALTVARQEAEAGNFEWNRLCIEIARRTTEVGAADPYDVRRSLSGIIEVERKTWRWSTASLEAEHSPQLQLHLK